MRLIWCLALLLLTACTSPPSTPSADQSPTAPSSPAPAFSAPTWIRQKADTLLYERLNNVAGGAGWNGGFVIVGSYVQPAPPNSRGILNDIIPVLHVSSDGTTWREISAISGLTRYAWGGAAAGHGDFAYVLGNGNLGPVVLSSEGGVWSRMPLPGARTIDEVSSISAGPRGVVVVGFGRRLTELGHREIEAYNSAEGLKVWYSADGITFGDPVTVPITEMSTSEQPRVVATDQGFLIYKVAALGKPGSVVMLRSEDGRSWVDIGVDFPAPPPGKALYKIDALQHNGNTTVAFGNTMSALDNQIVEGTGLTAWYRRDGEKQWTEALVEPGRMPDAGVVPREQRDAHAVVAWGRGFLALGTAGPTAVWTSEDGVRWKKTPVKDNGFDSSSRLVHLTDGGLTLMLPEGRGSSTGPVQFWRTGEPLPSKTSLGPVPRGGSWTQHAGKLTLDDNGAGNMSYQAYGDDGLAVYRTLQFKHLKTTTHGTRTMEITASDDPKAPKGKLLSAKVGAPGVVVLLPDGRQTEFCDNEHYGECGA